MRPRAKRAKSTAPGDGARRDAVESNTRERILASATRLFAEQGFDGASMPAIAKASGITAGAIYKHFESKGELLLEVVMRSFLSSPMFANSSERGNDASALPHLAAAYTEPSMKLVRQLSIEVHQAVNRDEKVKQVLSLSNRAAIDQISAGVAQAQREGKIDQKLNPEFVARVFCTFIMGLVHMDTLLPELVGDPAWHEFVRERSENLLGVR
jgi:AcrR family transcriptional regulator